MYIYIYTIRTYIDVYVWITFYHDGVYMPFKAPISKNRMLTQHSYPKVDQFATWSWPRKCFGVGQITGSWTCHWENWSIATEYVINLLEFLELGIGSECWTFWRRSDAQKDVSLGIPKWTGGMTVWREGLPWRCFKKMNGKGGFQLQETNRMKIFHAVPELNS